MPTVRGFSTNLSLPKVPLTTNPELFAELLAVYNALNALAENLDRATGAVSSSIEDSIGSTHTLEAGVAIAQSSLVSIKSDGKLYVADADVPLPCHGVCTVAGDIGDSVEFKLFGPIRYSTAVLTPGARYYLNLAGAIHTAAYTGSGNISQLVGVAITSTLLWFQPDINYTVIP